ncbi:MAG: nucleotide pyrophosphohydrolase [Patescibacteria group bacterium]
MNDNTIKEIQQIVLKFRDARDWRRFHHPKDLSMSIAIEAAELMELFQWKDTKDSIGNKEKIEEEFKKIINNPEFMQRINEELADVLIYCLFFADVLNIDIGEIIKMKIRMNETKHSLKESERKNKEADKVMAKVKMN